MNAFQEPKYNIDPSNGRLYNRQSGVIIPEDEPIFILRASDRHAAVAMLYYASLCGNPEHQNAVGIRAKQFAEWARQHKDRIKEPDTQMTADWTLYPAQ